MIVDRAARSLILICCAWIAASGCKSRQSEPASQSPQKTGEQSSEEDSSPTDLPPTIRFEAAAERLGIHFERYDDIRGERRIIESTGGGVGCFDYDCDGLIDVLFTGGCKLPLPADEPLKPTCGLFQNDWPTQFRDVSSASRLAQGGYCQGVAVGDFDSDGFDDIYIAAFGENGMWHNCGDGTFQCVTADAGVQCSSWSTSTATADVNQDGLLDLYVVNYLKESAEHPLKCPNPRAPDGFEQCPPAKYEGVDDVLFLNNGDGTFRDATETCGLKGKLGKGLGVAIFDFDGDFKPEIYVANDGEANFLLCNTAEPGQDPVYEDRGLTSGVALNYSGYAQASMGVAAGDYDQDGKVDLFLTNFYGDSSTVYRNFGGLHFEDLTRSTGLTGPSRKSLGWGAILADFDNDARLDIFVANGHVEDRTWAGTGEPYRMPPQVFHNAGNGRFVDVSANAGEYFRSKWLGRGTAVADFDRDGRMDLAVNHQLAPTEILLNRTQCDPLHSLRVIGTQSNRNATGCKIETLDDLGRPVGIRISAGGTSFQAAHSSEIMPLMLKSQPYRIRIYWPSGLIEEQKAPMQNLTVFIEGTGDRMPINAN